MFLICVMFLCSLCVLVIILNFMYFTGLCSPKVEHLLFVNYPLHHIFYTLRAFLLFILFV